MAEHSLSIENHSNSPFRGLGGEAIILAGGLGTRLRDAVPDLPKCMAPVAGRPFLFYVINELRMQGVEKFIFSLGYRHEVIEQYLAEQFSRLNYQYVIEDEPLGTGGGIRLAMQKTSSADVVVTNGDTLFKINLPDLLLLHKKKNADCTLALKPMQNFDRYGVVEIDTNNTITSFREKQFYKEGLINGGLYILNKEKFLSAHLADKFSFEKDYLEPNVVSGKLAGLPQDGYFIDIGIPEDYNRAQVELQRYPPDLKQVDKSWTLFLDRDGVINEDKPGSYILNTGEFRFMDGLIKGDGIHPPAFKKLSEKFKYIVIVTNQRGIGRGLMNESDLETIHQELLRGVSAAGGKIDSIQYCTINDNKDPRRKPNPGMALQAKAALPGIDFNKSIIVGNNLSDMQFGRNAGMFTVFVKTTIPDIQLPHPDIDLAFDSLADFAKAL